MSKFEKEVEMKFKVDNDILSKSKDLMYLIKNGGKQKMVQIDNRLIPEVNIGTLGH